MTWPSRSTETTRLDPGRVTPCTAANDPAVTAATAATAAAMAAGRLKPWCVMQPLHPLYGDRPPRAAPAAPRRPRTERGRTEQPRPERLRTEHRRTECP